MKILKTVFAALLLVTVGMEATCWAQDQHAADFGSFINQTAVSTEEADRERRRGGGMGMGMMGGGGGMGMGGISREMNRERRRGGESSAQIEAAQQVQQAAEKLYSAKEAEEKEAAKIALEKTLVHQFDLDTEKRSKELNEIKKRLTVMEALLEKRITGKEDIVALKLQVMVNNANGMGWTQGQQSWGASTYQSPGYQNPSSWRNQSQQVSRPAN